MDERLTTQQAKRPYTKVDDFFALGCLLYQMITGQKPPDEEKCPVCTCEHMNPLARCDHQCARRWRPDWDMSRLYQAYSTELLQLVFFFLLKPWSVRYHNAIDLLDRAMEGYRVWKAESPDGKLYRDAEDNIMARRALEDTQEAIRLLERDQDIVMKIA